MTLDDVAAEPTVHRGGPLEVDRATCGQPTQAGAGQRPPHPVGGELAAGQHFDNRQAHAVDGDRVAMTGVGSHHRTLDGEASGIAQVILTDDLTQFLNDSGEHRLRLVIVAPQRDAAATLLFTVDFERPATLQVMQTRPPTLAVLAPPSIAAAIVSGCSSSSKGSGAALPDAATLVKESIQSTKNVKSVHLALSVNGKIKPLPIKTLTGDLTTTPATAAQGNASITFGGSDIDAQFVVDSGT